MKNALNESKLIRNYDKDFIAWGLNLLPGFNFAIFSFTVFTFHLDNLFFGE